MDFGEYIYTLHDLAVRGEDDPCLDTLEDTLDSMEDQWTLE